MDYPFIVTNLGDAIKKKRLDLRMPKTQLARAFGVNPNTIWEWEDRGNQPLPKSMKKIIDWLGYVPPLGVDASNIDGQLYIYRMKFGLTQKEVAQCLKIDNFKIVKIEKGKAIERIYMEKAQELFKHN